MLAPSLVQRRFFLSHQLLLPLLLLAVCVTVNLLQPVTAQQGRTGHVDLPKKSDVSASTSAAKHPATGRQREQLLQLRSIVVNALKSAAHGTEGSRAWAIDGELPTEARARNWTGREPRHWWRTKPFFIFGISGGCVAIAILALLCVAPLYTGVDFVCNRRFSAGKKLDFSEDSSDGGSVCKEADATDCPSPFGVIRYQLKYIQPTEHLLVTVKGCSDLPRNAGGSLDPYVLVRIVGKDGATALGEAEVSATPVERGTTSPEFNFPCSFKLGRTEMTKAAVKFEVYDHDEASKEPKLVARCRHVLQDSRNGHEVDDLLVPSAYDERIFRCRLKRGQPAPESGPGDICVLLRRAAGEEAPLLVRVIECKGVHLRQSDGQADKRRLPNTYVDLMLMEPHGRIHARRSDTVSKCHNPYFNEEFSFPAMPADRLRQCALRLSLVHVSDFLRAKHAVGSVELSAEDEGNLGDRRFRLAREHWLAVTQAKAHQPASKCSWHSLVAPEEELQLRRARAMQARAATK